ncbi:PREDICTED: COMM domain-containing protein 10 [Haliaeetus leucocephalus]|uniref:COMM domain-containing protein 10 n=1 Tax=Haliaeetus leucocephalus TaxID=52644 RepID=UPI00053CBA6B|nr:PREDICTED: COMM domain-containing protein 10 [Haliaeetus leucocephalus]
MVFQPILPLRPNPTGTGGLTDVASVQGNTRAGRVWGCHPGNRLLGEEGHAASRRGGRRLRTRCPETAAVTAASQVRGPPTAASRTRGSERAGRSRTGTRRLCGAGRGRGASHHPRFCGPVRIRARATRDRGGNAAPRDFLLGASTSSRLSNPRISATAFPAVAGCCRPVREAPPVCFSPLPPSPGGRRGFALPSAGTNSGVPGAAALPPSVRRRGQPGLPCCGTGRDGTGSLAGSSCVPPLSEPRGAVCAGQRRHSAELRELFQVNGIRASNERPEVNGVRVPVTARFHPLRVLASLRTLSQETLLPCGSLAFCTNSALALTREAESIFSEEEEEKLQIAFSLEKQDLHLVLETISFILEQAVYHNLKPASLQQQLQNIHLDQDKAETFASAWAAAGQDMIEKFRQRVLTPQKLETIGWQLNLQMAESMQAKLKSPQAVLELGVSDEDSKNLKKVFVEFSHQELFEFYNKLETIQAQLDSLM